MQTTATTISVDTNFPKTMQPQPTQNMYVPSSGANNTNNSRTNQQTGSLYRGPSAQASRTNPRHVSLQPMYPQAMHQGVVLPFAPQYAPRQTYQTAPFSISQPMHAGHFYPYQYIQTLQPQPPAHQRTGVNVNTGVAVGSSIPVQSGHNGHMTGPAGGGQTSIPIAPGSVMTGAVSTVPNAVLSVAPSTSAQQIGVQPMISVLPTNVPTQTTPQINRLRKHCLPIIDPFTKKNILEDLDLTKNSSNSESDYQEQILPSATSKLQSDIQLRPIQPENSISVSGVLMITPESRTNASYNMDLTQIHQQREIIGQTPIVSAISDAPSVEIPSVPQKLKSKKTYSPKEQTGVSPTCNSIENSTQKIVQKEDSITTDYVQHKVAQPYESTQLSLTNTINQKQKNSDLILNLDLTNDQEEVLSEEKSTSITVNTTNTKRNKNIEKIPVEASSSHSEEFKATEGSDNPSECKNLCDPQQMKIDSADVVSELTLNNMQLSEKETSSDVASIRTKTDTYPKAKYATVHKSNGIPNQPIKKDIFRKDNRINTEASSDISAMSNIKETDKDKKKDIKGDETDRVSIPMFTPVSNSVKQLKTNAHMESNNIESNPTLVNTESTSSISVATTSISAVPEIRAETITIGEATDTKSSNDLSINKSNILNQSLINYNEGQWSPNNPTGKKQYDREQLLLLRDAKASRIQPEVNNVSILPSSTNLMLPSFVLNNNKRVQSMVGSIGGGNRGSDNGISGGNYGNKQSSMSSVHASNNMKGMMRINLSLNQDVKLNETDNAWRPRALVKNNGESDPEAKAKREKEELIRRIRGILNKLTPEKFDALVEEIIKLKIDTLDKMEDVMVLVFEKAIDEPNYSVWYALLCQRLINEVSARTDRMESGTKSNLAHFRNALLNKTEHEFTQNVVQSAAKEEKLKPIIEKLKNCNDPNEKAELQAFLEEEELKIRRRSGGTVRFIGELFKILLLTGNIINHCIGQLLKPNSEDMLECLCKLLTTVGAKFEETPIQGKDSTVCYSLEKKIARMQAIANKSDKDGPKVSSRVRFMLQDVIDLRANKWQSKRNEAPKTMDQIVKEAKTEHISSHYYSGITPVATGSNSNGSSQSVSKRDDRSVRYNDGRSSGYVGSHSQRNDGGSLRRQQQSGGAGSNNNNSIGGHINGNDDSAWHVQTSRGSRSLAVDTNKLEGLVLNQNMDINTKKMGGLSQFQWDKNASRQSSTPTTTLTNPFAALSSLVDSNRSNDRDRDRSGPRNKGSFNKGSMERDRYGDRNLHSRSGSSQASRENSSSRSTQGVRGMMNTQNLQKSASHSKYTQQMSNSRSTGKSSGVPSNSANTYAQNRFEQQSTTFSSLHSKNDTINHHPTAAPVAVFEEPNDNEFKLFKSMISEMIENAANTNSIELTTVSAISKIKDIQLCGFLYYILTDYLHLRDVGYLQRRHLANIVVFLLKNKYLSLDHFRLAYKEFCLLASDLIVDIPGLWMYIFEFTGPLIVKKIITITDLWIKELSDESLNLGKNFLKTYLMYCTQEIGPTYTRRMWKTFNMKWSDFMPESEVASFIKSNSFEYVTNEQIQPKIFIKETKDKHMSKVVEHIDYMLQDGSNADCIIDYINGNITDFDKQFIRSLTTSLSNFVITYKDASYKLETNTYQKICIPIFHHYIDSNDDRCLECLYSLQLLVYSLEHPRALLNEFFEELYFSEVIPQKSFLQWRDSNDQSAGKGVAVKGLTQFFNHILKGESSDENN